METVYLDHAATTPCDPRVLQAMQPFFIGKGGNASSPHKAGRQAHKAVEEARGILAAFIGARPVDIVFNSGASEGNNHAIVSTAQALRSKGRHIIASAIEHHSVLEPLHQLEKYGYQITLIKPKPDGIVDVRDIQSVLRPDTILVCFQHANNEIGTVQRVKDIGQMLKAQGTYLLVDATQTVGHIPVNVQDLHCDFLTLSAHKFYGPQGAGALYVRPGTEFQAFILGGDQERGRRAGTHNVPGIVGLGHAVKLCEAMPQEAATQEDLRDRVIDEVLKQVPGAVLNGHREQRLPNNAHFSFEGINGEELVSVLDLAGVCVSVGSACTWGKLEPSHVLTSIGLSDAMALGSLRVTVGRGNTEDDVDYFLDQLKHKVKQCRNASSNS